MKVVLQRVKNAKVVVEGAVVGEIAQGICLLVGIEKEDALRDAELLARKAVEMRIFPDAEGKMNLSLGEAGGEVLVVSQFTLAGSVKKGRRPSFDKAESPERAAELFAHFVELIRKAGFRVATGVFQAVMEVHLLNDGPVTFILDSKQ